MKKLIIFCILFINCIATVVFADNLPSTKSQAIVNAQQTLTSDQILRKQVNQKFNDYINARTDMMLYACTQKLAEYQGINLSPDFYKQEQLYAQTLASMQRDLNDTLSKAKQNFGRDFGQKVDELFQFEYQMPDLTDKTVTRGYCRSYETGFAQKIVETLNKYRLIQATKQNIPLKANAIYLNQQFQIINMTSSLKKQMLPSVIIIGTKSYPIHCINQDVQKYDEAISINIPITDNAYNAYQYFFQNYSPQIDYILDCKINIPLTTNTISKINDTYPWYQPIITGSQNEPAAGDVLSYINHNNIVIILGHEPCVCNKNTEQDCDRIKSFSREYKQKAWQMFAALDKEKIRHNLQAQQAINDYLIYGKNEIKKDFCYIDKKAMIAHINAMIAKVQKAEPNGVINIINK